MLQLPLRKTEYPENMMTMMKKMKPYLRESSRAWRGDQQIEADSHVNARALTKSSKVEEERRKGMPSCRYPGLCNRSKIASKIRE